MTTPKTYRNKPVQIQALQYDGSEESRAELRGWSGGVVRPTSIDGFPIVVQTLEGQLEVTVGDFVIRGIKGEFYPCKPDIFEGSYDAVPDVVPAPESDEVA